MTFLGTNVVRDNLSYYEHSIYRGVDGVVAACVDFETVEIRELVRSDILSLADRPTCIIYPDDFSCIGGINVIRNYGLDVPGDISVADYGGQRIARVMEPRVTTYRQNTEEIGKTAARKLIELIEQPDIALIERVDVKGELIQGKSVRSMR